MSTPVFYLLARPESAGYRTGNEGAEDHRQRIGDGCPIRGARCVDPYVPRTLLGTDRMTRHLHIAEHWLRMNFWKWLPALAAVGIVLACLAHMNDPQSAFMASSAIRG
jgi:hypothetical protein